MGYWPIQNSSVILVLFFLARNWTHGTETNQPGTEKNQSSSGINCHIYKTALPTDRKQNEPTGWASFTGWVSCTSHTLCCKEGLGWHPATATADHEPEWVMQHTAAVCTSQARQRATTHTSKSSTPGLLILCYTCLLHMPVNIYEIEEINKINDFFFQRLLLGKRT